MRIDAGVSTCGLTAPAFRTSSEAWQAKQATIAEEANRKRSEAAKGQPRKDGRLAEKQVVGHNVLPPAKQEPGKTAKATASKTNPGAVARGDKLAKHHPEPPPPTGR